MVNNKSKLRVIVDGNWLLMSRWAVLNGRFYEDAEMCRELQLTMVKSINVVLRTFPSIDNIIFVSDGGSWRQKIPMPSFMIDEYKGNRELDPTINWDMIFSYYEEFVKLLEENGITACRVQGVEGDDWCWYWSNKLNSEGTNCIIWSMDKDLTQLVKTDHTTGVFTVCWNKNGVVVEEGDYSENTDLDFFFGDLNKENNDRYFHEVISKSTKVSRINPKEVVIDKIIRGDKGDNIFPIITRTSAKGTVDKLFRVSTKDVDMNLDIHNENEVKQYISNLLSMKNYAGRVVKKVGDDYSEKTPNEILEHFNYNVRLVTLEKQSYPDDILEQMNTYTGYVPNRNISSVTSYITAKSNKLSSILDII
jgi:5'-3' exonuclease